MARVVADRMCARIEGDFVVFIIGVRINAIWKVHKWLPVFLAMPRMLKELSGMPPHGLGKAATLVPARDRFDTARGRLGATTSSAPTT